MKKTIIANVSVSNISDSDMVACLQLLLTHIAPYAERFRLTEQQIRSLEVEFDAFLWAMKVHRDLVSYAHDVKQFKKHVRCVPRYEAFRDIKKFEFPEFPSRYSHAEGNLNHKLTKIVRQIKMSSEYTDEIGAELGIANIGVLFKEERDDADE